MKAFQKAWYIEGIAFESGNKHQNPLIIYSYPKIASNCYCASRYPLGTGCKLKVDKTFRRRPGHSIYVLCLVGNE